MNSILRKTVYYLIASVWVSMLPFSAFAQNSLTGKVTVSTTGNPLPDVHVYVHELKRGTMTSNQGTYEIDKLPTGTITVEYSFLGYGTVIKNVSIKKGHQVTLNIALKPATYESGKVVVIGSRTQSQKDTPLPMEVLNSRQLTMSHQPTLWNTLSQTPGMALISNGPGIVRPVIRGLSSNRILILNQNTPYFYQKWDPESGLTLNGNGAEQVEVIKGPATIMYGQGAMGGVINLIGEHPAPVGQTMGNYTLKAFSNTLGLSNNLAVKGSKKNYFWGARGGFDSNADYTAGNGADVPNTRYNDLQFHAFGGITRSWGSTKITYQFQQHKNGIVDLKDLGTGGDEGKPRKIEEPYHNLKDNSIISETQVALGGGWLNTTFSYQNNRQQEFDKAPANPANANDAGIDLTLNTFTYQVKYDNDLGNNFNLSVGVQGDAQKNTSKGQDVFIPNANIGDLGGYGFLAWTKDNLSLQGGIRYDIRNLKTTQPAIADTGAPRTVPDEISRHFNNFSWSAGATYHITSEWNLKTNVGIGYRAPNLAELTADGLLKEQSRFLIGANNLNPERNTEWDLGTNVNTNDISFSVSAYYNWIHNFIYQERQAGLYTDPKDGSQYGIYKFMQNNAELWGGETYLDIHPQNLSWIRFNTSYDMVVGQLSKGKSPLPMMPAHRWRNDLSFIAPVLGTLHNPHLDIIVDHYFRQDRVGPYETTSPDYTLTDIILGSSFPWGKQTVRISIAVENLFDVAYQNHLSILRYDGIYNMGRNVSFTVNIPFGL